MENKDMVKICEVFFGFVIFQVTPLSIPELFHLPMSGRLRNLFCRGVTNHELCCLHCVKIHSPCLFRREKEMASAFQRTRSMYVQIKIVSNHR